MTSFVYKCKSSNTLFLKKFPNPIITDDAQLLWVNFNNDYNESEIKNLLESLNVSSFLVDDFLKGSQIPKTDIIENESLSIFNAIPKDVKDIDFKSFQLICYFRKDLLITRNAENIVDFNNIISKSPDINPINIFFNLINIFVTNYLNVFTSFEKTLIETEALAIKNNSKALDDLVNARYLLIKNTRSFKYNSEAFEELADEFEDWDLEKKTQHKISATEHRLSRLLTLAEMQYTLCGDIVDGYISITSYKLNNVMQLLTIITAIFVPLSFLTGLYGMNFDYIPELKYKYGYFILLGAMLIITTGLIYFFKKRKWL